MPAAKYRKKPMVIEALQWTGDVTYDMLNFGCSGPQPLFGADFQVDTASKQVEILTLNGVVKVDVGDWVIRGVHGEFYPCRPDIFSETYEPVNEEVSQ